MATLSGEAGLQAMIEGIQAAGLGQGTWLEALEGVGLMTGSRRAQLIGFTSSGAVTFNWVTATDPQAFVELEEAGCNDARVNSRLRVGISAPVLKLMDEADFDTEEDVRRYPDYGAHLERWDIPYLSLVNLIRTDDLHVGLSLNRGARDGALSPEQKRLFSEAALHARQALRTQSLLGQQSIFLLSGALERLSLICFVCRPDGRILGATSGAEQLLVSGDRLRSRHGRLEAVRGDGALAAGFAAASEPSGPRAAPIVVRDASGARPLLLEVTPLPYRRWAIAFEQALLVTVREPTPHNANRAADKGARMFQFTPTETTVAAQMLAGRSPAQIADQLGVSVGTVRTRAPAL